MGKRIYIFGNGNLSFSEFTARYVPVLEAALAEPDTHFLLCDFRGADTLALEYLKDRTGQVTVYHVAERPRYFPDRYRTKVSQWEVRGGFPGDAERDAQALADCTHFLAFDYNTSAKRQSGTDKNIRAGLDLGKIRLGVEEA